MPSKALSHYAILMNFQQKKCGAGNICIHRFGSLADMRRLDGQTCDGSVRGWPAKDWSMVEIETITMLDTSGNDLSGVIAKLSYVHASATRVKVIAP